jgi:ubiquinone/menaquinone biosynthesis C-methylase UbiE
MHGMGFVLDIEGAHLASIRRLSELRGRRVLEIGCGDGRLTKGIAAEAAWVLAFDTKAALVDSAAKLLEDELRRDCVRLSVASAVDVELPRSDFDLAVFSWSY